MRFSQEPSPEQLLDLAHGARLATMEPEMTQFIEKMMQQTQQRMFTAIAAGILTPDMAVQGWHELHASYRLLQKYKQTVRVGVSTGFELTQEK